MNLLPRFNFFFSMLPLSPPPGVTVHTAGRDEEHADEEVLQNNSL